jgi:excisionase family DNA binding protein
LSATPQELANNASVVGLLSLAEVDPPSASDAPGGGAPSDLAAPAVPGRRRSRWVSLARACEILGVNESTVRRWADSGEIHTFRTPGGHRRFDEGELHQVVQNGGHQPQRSLGDAAVTRIRRQLHSNAADARWYRHTDTEERDALRPIGRRLVEIVDDYLARRSRRDVLEEEVSRLGEVYGGELRRRGMPLSQAIEAFTFFRRSLDETAKQLAERNGMSVEEASAAREQVAALADRVLLSLTAMYDIR